MASLINSRNRIFTVGIHRMSIDVTSRASQAVITMERLSWPSGQLFNWKIIERDRGGEEKSLCSGREVGGPIPRRDGEAGDAALSMTLTFPPGRDKDMVALEIEVFQQFSTHLRMEFK